MRKEFGVYLKSSRVYILCVCMIVLAASLPLMTNYVLQGDDVLNELNRIELMTESLFSTFPVRMQPVETLEYGRNAADFQTNLYLVIPALLRLFGIGPTAAYQLTLWMTNAATAAIAFICFSKCFARPELGLLGSMLYTWCPYRLNTLYGAGDLGEGIAWCFIPLLLLGLSRLYQEREGYEKSWLLMSAALGLTGAASLSVLLVEAAMAFLWFLCMGKRAFARKKLLLGFKTVIMAGFLDAWVLLPWLYFLYKNQGMAARVIAEDFGAAAIPFANWFLTFFQAEEPSGIWIDSVNGIQNLSTGFAVTMCVLFYVWRLFTRGSADGKERNRGRRLLFLSLIFIWLAGGLFPWELLRNQNLMFSVFLAWMKRPAVWGIGACALLIFLSCHTLYEVREQAAYPLFVGTAMGVSYLMTQFFLGNLLSKRESFGMEEGLVRIPFQVITQVPLLFRISEVISLAALVFLIGFCMMRRKKNGILKDCRNDKKV